jgi:hypothetical protein
MTGFSMKNIKAASRRERGVRREKSNLIHHSAASLRPRHRVAQMKEQDLGFRV